MDAASRPRQHREADDFERLTTSTESVVASVAEAIVRQDLAVDYVQVDAGWYRLLPNKLGKDAWAWSCGNWTPDPARYPNGMRAAADAVHANGLKYILWFEPERAMVGTETHQEHHKIRYIMGLYEYFDALRREHPHLIIDSSASGGRRIDFEMLSGRSRSIAAT